MAITVEQFIERLSQSGLMSAAEISAFRDSLPPAERAGDAQALAASLVKADKLTKYQAQAIYQGKTKGLVFGEYVVLDKLGQGGMSVVLKARHRRMGRLAAIKVLASSTMKQPGAVERFHREVQAAAKLSHPNIVTAYDADEQEGMYYLVMQCVEGRNLATIVKQQGPLEVRQALECVLQAARGLQYAHGQGIVHRDVKPGNLLLDKEGTVKILDMGLARIAGAEAAMDGSEQLTAAGTVMGTCDYMAPEQAFDSHNVDLRADIYSLGCTLYRLLTGHSPFPRKTLMQILLAHRESPIPSLREARSEVSAELDAVYQKMMAKRPEDRYGSMAEVVAELEPMLAVLSGHALPAVAEAESSGAAVSRSLAFLDEDESRGTVAQQKMPAAAQRTQPHIGAGKDTVSNVLGKARAVVAKLRGRPWLLAGLAGGLLLLLSLSIVLVLTFRHGTLVIDIDEALGREVQVAVSQGGERVQLADAKSGWTLSLSPGKYELAVRGGGDRFLLDSKTVVVKRGEAVTVLVTMKPRVPAAHPAIASASPAVKALPNADDTRKLPPARADLSGEKKEVPNIAHSTASTQSPAPPPNPESTTPPAPPAVQVSPAVDSQWKLPAGAPPPAVAPFDAQKAKEHQAAWAGYVGTPVEITNSIGMKLALIPPGEFEMGVSKEVIEEELKAPNIEGRYKDRLPGQGPAHRVRITRPFYLGTYLVTQAEYERVTGQNPSGFSATGEGKDNVAGQDTRRLPVETVSWGDSVEFCRKLSELPEEKAAERCYRLPSDAQWEYACRAGSTGRYSFSSGDPAVPKEHDESALSDYGWSSNNSAGMTHAVGLKQANAWGLYDVHGNVWEWCQDWYDKDYYTQSPLENPGGAATGVFHVARGGCGISPAGHCWSAARDKVEPAARGTWLGLRVSLIRTGK
jgi:serine/threonine protein kinase/formylglycine-generating enzyme required for sulfatase activity